jgi:hypothetical protein
MSFVMYNVIASKKLAVTLMPRIVLIPIQIWLDCVKFKQHS